MYETALFARSRKAALIDAKRRGSAKRIFCNTGKEGVSVRNVLEYFEQTVQNHQDAAAVDDGVVCYTWLELMEGARRIASAFRKTECTGKAIPVVMEKSADTLAAFLGVVYAGSFYVLINPDYPTVRIENILKTLEAKVLLADIQYQDKIRKCGFTGTIVDIEKAKNTPIEKPWLKEIRKQSTSQDLLYGIFTSGSTGSPKGVVVSHGAVIDFIEEFIREFHLTDQEIIGNQAPFDFDVSVKDIYTSIFTGAKLVLISKELFSMPPSLLDYLAEKRVTVLIWAVSALCIVTTLHGFDYRIPKTVKKVMFSGEVMPFKHLCAWRAALPDAEFINLYGPTEIVCNCTYYRVNGEEIQEKPLPIGNAFCNRNVFLLDEKNREVCVPEKCGEICVTGVSLASGYYNNPQATEKSFVQNPLNKSFHEVIYRTGDIGYYNEYKELCFLGRRDFQIKRMGHRIELEEIQLMIEKAEGVDRACCIYDEKEHKLVAFYVGSAERKEVRRGLKTQVPGFMVPDKFVPVSGMPLTKNGKINREALWNDYKTKGGRE